MPTAARLFAALCLAALGYVTSDLIKAEMPASTEFGIFSILNTVLGLVVGWVVLGGRAGRGSAAAVSNGFTAMVVFVFWGLFIQGVNEMTRLAMRRKYDDMFEAGVAIFQLMAEYAMIMATPQILLTLLVGGVLSGIVSEAAARRWR